MRILATVLCALASVGACAAPVGSIEPPAPEQPTPAEPPDAARSPVQTSQSGCPHVEGDDAKLFEFAAFGPPSMSHALLGQAWWQWDHEGHDFDASGGVVWIVVHEGVAPDALATRFPVREAERCDHRYVSVRAAMAYLEDNIAELDGSDVPALASLLTQLRSTRTAVATHFELHDAPK